MRWVTGWKETVKHLNWSSSIYWGKLRRLLRGRHDYALAGAWGGGNSRQQSRQTLTVLTLDDMQSDKVIFKALALWAV